MLDVINYIRLINFESWKDQTFHFNTKVNVIVGANDQGKTGIFRAIEWVWKNRPIDNEFRPHNIDPKEITSVEIGIGKNIIRREYSNTINKYYLNEEPLEGFKLGVPKEIADTLNMDDINLQSQMSPIFLLSNSSGEVARYLNKITKLDDIDKSTSYIKKDKDKLHTYLTNKNLELESINTKLKNYDCIDLLSKKVSILENLEKEKIKLYGILRRVEDICKEKKDKTEQLNEYEKILKYKNKIDKLNKLIIGRKKRYDLLTQSNWLLQKKENLLVNLPNIKVILKESDKINKLVSKIEERKSLLINKKELINKHDNIINIKEQIQFRNKKLKEINNNLKEYEKEYKELMGKECPFCGSRLEG